MMRALLLLLLLFTFHIHAQQLPQDTIPLSEPNLKMLDFTEKNLGKKIGGGICAEFVSAAMEHAIGVPHWSAGREIDLKREFIKPGDVLYMRWYKGKRGRRVTSHVAIITKVMEPHLVEVAHQNFNSQKFVVKSTYDLNQKIRAGRRVIIYRPEEGKR